MSDSDSRSAKQMSSQIPSPMSDHLGLMVLPNQMSIPCRVIVFCIAVATAGSTLSSEVSLNRVGRPMIPTWPSISAVASIVTIPTIAIITKVAGTKDAV